MVTDAPKLVLGSGNAVLLLAARVNLRHLARSRGVDHARECRLGGRVGGPQRGAGRGSAGGVVENGRRRVRWAERRMRWSAAMMERPWEGWRAARLHCRKELRPFIDPARVELPSMQVRAAAPTSPSSPPLTKHLLPL